jgi:hypothetical protein
MHIFKQSTFASGKRITTTKVQRKHGLETSGTGSKGAAVISAIDAHCGRRDLAAAWLWRSLLFAWQPAGVPDQESSSRSGTQD